MRELHFELGLMMVWPSVELNSDLSSVSSMVLWLMRLKAKKLSSMEFSLFRWIGGSVRIQFRCRRKNVAIPKTFTTFVKISSGV